jgi:hypothetical protein
MVMQGGAMIFRNVLGNIGRSKLTMTALALTAISWGPVLVVRSLSDVGPPMHPCFGYVSLALLAVSLFVDLAKPRPASA